MSTVINESFAACEKIARDHYENFPIGWFVPRAMKKYVFALYAFARTADDFADEAGQSDRLEKLQEWRRLLMDASTGRAEHPIFVALSETFRDTAVQPRLLEDLLRAFELDVTKSSYQNYDELLDYCRYSANPVGRLVLLLFGYQDPALLELSDKICTGIQLVNHWQDIAVDLQKKRIYLPEEDLSRFHYSRDELENQTVNAAFISLMKFEMDRVRALFYEGLPLLGELGLRLRCQVSLMWKGPMRILEKIEQTGYDVFTRRPSLSRRELVALLFRPVDSWQGGR